jgi:type I restriction enzyme S subunit
MKPGFMRTEASFLLDEWESQQLGDLLDQSRSVRYGIVQPGKFDPAGCLMLRSQDYSKGWAGPDQMHRVNRVLENQYKNARIHGDDLIITVVGAGIGQVVVAPSWLDGAILSRSTARIAIDEEKASPGFVKALLESPVGKRQILDCQKEGAQPVVSCRDLAKFYLPHPPLSEQRAIATVSRDVDALLVALDRLIAKKRDIKQFAMQQLLTGQTRLPGFYGKWEEVTLGQIGECIIGLTYKPENVVEHGLLVLRSSNVQNGRLAYDDNVHVNLEVAEHLYTRPGDILICVRNGSRALIGKCALIDRRAAGVTFGAFMSVYRTKHWRFTIHAFQAGDIQRQIHDNIGATINQITNKDMKAFRLKLPPEDEQIAIASVLTDMDAELAALEQRREKTRALKQGMPTNISSPSYEGGESLQAHEDAIARALLEIQTRR